jgi:hypothetical protein
MGLMSWRSRWGSQSKGTWKVSVVLDPVPAVPSGVFMPKKVFSATDDPHGFVLPGGICGWSCVLVPVESPA